MIFRTLLMLLALCPITTMAQGETRWFDVEIVIFSQQSDTDEHWPTAMAEQSSGGIDLFKPIVQVDKTTGPNQLPCDANQWIADPNACSRLGQSVRQVLTWPNQIDYSLFAKEQGLVTTSDFLPQKAPSPMQGEAQSSPFLLPYSQAKLSPELKKISAQAGVKPLIHTLIRMPIGPKSQAIPIKLYAGKNWADRYLPNGLEKNEQNLKWDFATILGQPQDNRPIWEVDGELTLHLDHYLYADVKLDLAYEVQNNILANLDNQQEGRLLTYPLNQTRRMYSERLYYFDHPKMGILIQIRKIEE